MAIPYFFIPPPYPRRTARVPLIKIFPHPLEAAQRGGIFEQYGFILLLVVLAAVAAFATLGGNIAAFITNIANMF
jgi:hypothetical protein